MRSAGHGYSHFRRCLDARNPDAALAAATDLPSISLEDALDVCELLAEKGDRRYAAAARRWLARYGSERRPSLADLQVATDALESLESQTDCQMALRILKGLL